MQSVDIYRDISRVEIHFSSLFVERIINVQLQRVSHSIGRLHETTCIQSWAVFKYIVFKYCI